MLTIFSSDIAQININHVCTCRYFKNTPNLKAEQVSGSVCTDATAQCPGKPVCQFRKTIILGNVEANEAFQTKSPLLSLDLQ